MSGLMCCLWWFLAGLLLGWLFHWLFDKFFRRGGDSGDQGTRSTSAPAAFAPAAPVAAPASTAATGLSAVAIASAAGFGFGKLKSPNGYDNFEIIEGIGPKINGVLHAAGVHTFSQLAAMDIASISKILDAAGPNFKLANPQSWAQQSGLCASGAWEALKKLQDELVAGVALAKDENA